MSELSWKEILNAAVKSEEQSYALYTLAQKKVVSSSSKKLLAELAKDELRHREKLSAVLKGKEKLQDIGSDRIQDLKIVDPMEDITLSKDSDYQQILIYAAKREKSTYDYYNSMAAGLDGTKFAELFLKLAEEELRHKNRIEQEYDEYVLKED